MHNRIMSHNAKRMTHENIKNKSANSNVHKNQRKTLKPYITYTVSKTKDKTLYTDRTVTLLYFVTTKCKVTYS